MFQLKSNNPIKTDFFELYSIDNTNIHIGVIFKEEEEKQRVPCACAQVNSECHIFFSLYIFHVNTHAMLVWVL